MIAKFLIYVGWEEIFRRNDFIVEICERAIHGSLIYVLQEIYMCESNEAGFFVKGAAFGFDTSNIVQCLDVVWMGPFSQLINITIQIEINKSI